MAEAFVKKAIADAVISITSFKSTSTGGNEQPTGLLPNTPHAVDLASSNGSNSQTNSAESPTTIPGSAIAPTSSMEVGLGDIIQHAAQQSPPRRFPYKAPSSTGDLAAGFSYAKAVPPQWNLSRQKRASQDNNKKVPQIDTRSSTHKNGPDMSSEPEPTSTAPSLTSISKTIDVSTDTSLTPNRSNATAKAPVLDTGKVESLPTESEPAMDHNSSPPKSFTIATTTSQLSPHPTVASPKHPERVAKDTVMQEMGIEQQPIQPPHLTEAFSPPESGNRVATPKQQALNRPMRMPKPCTPKKPRGFKSRSKVTKSPRHSHVPNNGWPRMDLDDLTSKVTEEDLLQVLLTRYSRDKQEREQMRANHATEIHELETLSHSLWQRLQECQQEAQDQETELSGFRTREPKFNSQIKKLTNYVKGLTNDQHGLRDNFMTMQRMHSAAHESKQEIVKSLEDVRGVVSHVDKRTVNALKDARQELSNLARIVQDQESQLQKDVELLQYERERSQRLEIEVGKINTSQQHAMHTLAGHANLVSENMKNVLVNLQEVQAVRQPESLDEVKTALRKCLSVLEELRQAPTVKSEHFSGFEDSMKTIAHGITNTLQSYHDDLKSSGLHDSGIVAGLKEQLETLTASIATEHDLGEQMRNIATKKAEVEVKLYAAGESLQQARQQVAATDSEKRKLLEQVAKLESEAVALRGSTENAATNTRLGEIKAQNDKLQSHLESLKQTTEDQSTDLKRELLEQVVKLESEAVALRSEPKESAATIARLGEIKAQNEKLQSGLDTLNETIEINSTDLRSRFEDHASFQLFKEDLESQLRKEQDKANEVANERLELERKANIKFESMRSELMHAAKFDKNLLWAEHRLALAEVEERLREATGRTNKMTVEMDKQNEEQGKWALTVIEQMKLVSEMRRSKDIAEASCAEQTKTIENLSKERQELMDYKTATEINLHELRKELEEKKTEVANCQQSLRLGVEDINKKDKEIREQNSRITERTIEARRAQQALQTDKANHEAEILKLKKELEATNARVGVLAKDANQDNNTISPRPRRKADRCAIQEMQQVVKESQSQIDIDLAGFHSPQSSQEMLDDGMRYIDPKELEAFYIPPTPEQSSRVGKKTVSFASGRMSEYFGSQIASPSKPRPYRESRVVEDSQDRLSPIRQPSFETPSYRSRNSQAVADSYTVPGETSSAPSLLRPALKSSNTATKRSTTGAALSNGAEPKRRRSSTVGASSLGPILPDTQSPSGGVHRSRRIPRSAATIAKGDMYAKRFAEELSR